MKKVYFTVGPSQVYPTINKHIISALKEDILSLNHRGLEFKKLFKSTTEGLRKLLKIPSDYQIFFLSSALEGMERSIEGCVQKYSFHVITGSFGKAWATYASNLGKTILKAEAKPGDGLELPKLYVSKDIEMICITQNDTSTGIWIPMEDIYGLSKKYPEKLIATDFVSSIPYVDIDFKFIDIAFLSVQKGFGLPAGLGVIIVSPKALAKTEALSKRGLSIGSYHSLKNLKESATAWETPETPNVLNIYLLDKVVKDMLKVGIKKIRQETNQKSKILYDHFENHKKYTPAVKNTKFRSPTTAVFNVEDSENLRKKLDKKGFIVGAGYENNKSTQIRIANFPSHKLADLKSLLKLI